MNISRKPRTIKWRKSLAAALLWFVGCSLSGLAIAAASGEHGSIIFVMFGVAIGVCGGISNASLVLWFRFAALPTLQRIVAVWSASMALFLAFGVVLSWPPTELPLIATYVAVPTLLVSVAVNFLLSRKNVA
jgi:hypothetical protein